MENPAHLDVSSLEKALAHLNTYRHKACQSKQDPENYEAFRAASIQAFEYCYELCLRIMRRYLELTEDSSAEVEELSFMARIRLGAERGIIHNPELWFEFRKKRNITSHTYDEKKAAEVFALIKDFEEEALYLLGKLKSRGLN